MQKYPYVKRGVKEERGGRNAPSTSGHALVAFFPPLLPRRWGLPEEPSLRVSGALASHSLSHKRIWTLGAFAQNAAAWRPEMGGFRGDTVCGQDLFWTQTPQNLDPEIGDSFWAAEKYCLHWTPRSTSASGLRLGPNDMKAWSCSTAHSAEFDEQMNGGSCCHGQEPCCRCSDV